MIVGSGDYRYRQVDGWAKGRTLGIASGVAADSRDRVYVLDREPSHEVVVFDRDGQFLSCWGGDLFVLPHDIWVDSEDRLYIADCGDHTVRICSGDGEILDTLGTLNQPGAEGVPFNQPTRAVRAPSGDLYVSDGYGNQHIHHFSAAGELLHTWGGRGEGPGQFTLAHNVFATPDGRLMVADRESNNRMQLFDAEGKFLEQWPGRPGPCGLFIDGDGTVFIAEGGGVTIMNSAGQLLTQWVVTGGPNNRPHGAHGIWVDRHGDIYVGEVGTGDLLHKFARV